MLRSARRPLLLGALAPLLLAACQRPHVHDASCESGLVKGAPAAQAAAPAQPSATATAAAAVAAPELSSADALASFDEAWQTIHDTHFDPKFNGVDWDAVKTELRPRAEAAHTRAELRAVIGEMIGRLGQSHFGLIPSDILPDAAGGGHDQSGGLGFDVRLRDGQIGRASCRERV